MRKVINMFTREEMTELLISQEHGKNIIEHLMKYVNAEDVTHYNPEYGVIDSLIRIIENNSGVSKDEILLERFLKQQVGS